MSTENIIDIYANKKINWGTTTIMGLFHVGAVAALFMFNWHAFAVAIFLYWMCTGLGISMGYHRLHTHRSYKLPVILEYFFAVCGTLTLEGGPIFWVATHRIHHQNSDQPGDPHSPRDGAWWAHMGWILFGRFQTQQHAADGEVRARSGQGSLLRLAERLSLGAAGGAGAVLFAVGGLPMLLWGTCVRIVFGLHATWLVNSATHMWGGRRFDTRDDSRNNWWVALITFGEGWHNNHHAHPTSARHGLAWYEFDPSWIQITILKYLGIAKSIRVAKTTSALAEKEAA